MLFDISTVGIGGELLTIIILVLILAPIAIKVYSSVNKIVKIDSSSIVGLQSDASRIASMEATILEKDKKIDEKDQVIFRLISERADDKSNMNRLETELGVALNRIEHLTKLVKYLIEASGGHIPAELLLDDSEVLTNTTNTN